MVLQQKQKVPVWGWADPGESVTVTIAGQTHKTNADGKGHWQVHLYPIDETGPHTMKITGENIIEFKDVLVGEVWICSGQSNMEWQLRLSKNAYKNNKNIPPMPELVEHPLKPRQQPTSLYNGMIHPLVPYAIRGAIWYQGESNRHDGMIYSDKMKALIRGWRQVWGQDNFPFYFVQLAPYSYGTFSDEPQDYILPIIREAQRKALDIPNTGMAVITDIGNIYDIHPRNKQEVGRRLALWALANDYGKTDLVFCGPLYQSINIVGDHIVLEFDHVGSGLKSNDGKPLNWFEIAGADGKFVKATAVITGHTISVSNPNIQNPVAVRFGWHEEAEPNFVNQENLPASPFSTQSW